MYNMGIRGVTFMVCNTDQQALDKSPVMQKICLKADGPIRGSAPATTPRTAGVRS